MNIFLGFFFLVNFCVGTGFLGIPYSFFYAGYLAAIPTFLLISFAAWNAGRWEIEIMARAQVRTVRKSQLCCVMNLSRKMSPSYDISSYCHVVAVLCMRSWYDYQ